MVFGLVELVVSLGQTCEQGGLGDLAQIHIHTHVRCNFAVGFLACVVFAVSDLAAIQPGSTDV